MKYNIYRLAPRGSFIDSYTVLERLFCYTNYSKGEPHFGTVPDFNSEQEANQFLIDNKKQFKGYEFVISKSL